MIHVRVSTVRIQEHVRMSHFSTDNARLPDTWSKWLLRPKAKLGSAVSPTRATQASKAGLVWYGKWFAHRALPLAGSPPEKRHLQWDCLFAFACKTYAEYNLEASASMPSANSSWERLSEIYKADSRLLVNNAAKHWVGQGKFGCSNLLTLRVTLYE